jgi:hypothetical protein
VYFTTPENQMQCSGNNKYMEARERRETVKNKEVKKRN